MTRPERIKFAVIGQGHIGKRHAEMIRRNSESELIAVCDILPVENTGNTCIEENYYDSAEQMLANHPEIEVINICTPNGFHTSHSLMALDAGKHVICEKPMALSTLDCKRIIEKAKNKNRQVFCVAQNRYSPPSVWLKSLLNKNILGDIYLVQLNCFWNRDERYYKKDSWKGRQNLDGGTLFTQFSHFIDTLFWMFGDIKDIQAKFNDFNHKNLTQFEDSGIVNFNFVKTGMGIFNYSTSVWDVNLESSMTVIGSYGSVKIGGQYMEKVEYCHIKNYTLPVLSPVRPANDYGVYKGSANNHDLVIQNVVDTLKGRDESNTNVEDGLKVVDIIERIYSLRKTNLKT